MGMGLLLSFASGAGNAMADQAQQRQKLSDQSTLDAERSKMEEEKMARLDELKRGRDRSAQVTQGQEIDASTRQIQNERDAANINAANGSQMTAEDAAVLRNNPAARKAYGLLDSTRQSDLEDRASGAQKAGYTPEAREIRNELQTEINSQKQDAATKDANRRMDRQEARDVESSKHNQATLAENIRNNKAQEAISAINASKQGMQMERAELQSTRLAISSVLKDKSDQIENIEAKISNPMLVLTDEERRDLKKSLKTLNEGHDQASNALLKLAGIEPLKEKEKARPYEDGTRLQKDGKIYVVKNGVPVLEGSSTEKPKASSAEVAQKRKPVLGEEGFGPGREGRSPINTREQTVGRGKTKQQYQNPSTGVWYDTQDEAIQSLKK